ncbi:dipeptide ABC transporter ATP-binding protein [Aliihoeflea sp. PC F10.4]
MDGAADPTDADQMNDLLRIENLMVDFRTPAGRIRAVGGISFRVPRGRTVALVGESGSGKSVTAHAIMGLLPRIARMIDGSIIFDDGQSAPLDLATLPPRSKQFAALRGARISMIFQEPSTSFSAFHTIGAQITEALMLHESVGAKEARARAIAALEAVGFKKPDKQIDAYPFELSGGLNQRAMIAMATITRPALLIADEPTTALDVTVQAEILRLLRDLQQQHGTAILLIAHDLGVVANLADEMVVMHHGRVMESGTAAELFAEPRHPYLKALIGAVPKLHMPRSQRLKPLREIKVSIKDRDAPKEMDGEILLRASGLMKRFTSRKSGLWSRKDGADATLAVNNVSFEIRRGECFGLVGESGSGKTTVTRILARGIDPDAGTVLMADAKGGETDVLALSGEDLRQWRRRIQFVFQNPYSALNPRMTVGSIVTEPLTVHGVGTPASRRAKAVELMHLVGLDESHLTRYPHSFSGGQRQRIGIARALALDPELLVLDEPVSALDVSVQAQILNLLRDLKDKLGLTCLFISHNLAVVDYLADRIAVMSGGRLVETAPRDSLFKDPRHPYTRSLIMAVPEPDPDNKLDLDRIGLTHSGSSQWGPNFLPSPDGAEPGMVEAGPGHTVRAHEVPPPQSLGGRSLAEHQEIEKALVTDPKGEPTVHLDFSSGTLDGWSTRRLTAPYSAKVDDNRARVGRFSCRFELRPGDNVSQGTRAELRDWWNAEPESECWYGFSTFLPEDFAPPPDTGIVLAQWHDQARLGQPSGKPPLALRYLDGRVRFTGAAGPVASPSPETIHLFAERPATPGAWMDIVVRAFWSRDANSEIDAYVNGDLMFSHRGPLGYRNQDKGPYFKLGLYASGPFIEPLVAWHDNYSRGGDFAAVNPATLHTTVEAN